MSAAADTLLGRLHYDSDARTLAVSSLTRALAPAAQALRSAFGEGVIAARDVTLVSVPSARPEVEFLAFTATATAFGASREVYAEVTIVLGEVTTLLVMIPVPTDGWSLATGFPGVKDCGALSGLQIRGGAIVISAGLEQLPGPRTVGARTLAYPGAELDDGLQLLGTGLVRGGGDLPASYWEEAARAGTPPALVPDRKKRPNWIEARGDVALGTLTLDAWWSAAASPPELGTSRLIASGFSLAYRFGSTQPPSAAWLWELDVGAADPLVLRAPIWEGYRLCFAVHPTRPLPLGASLACLSTLAGQDLTSLAPDASALSLASLEYVPGRSLSLAVALGSTDPLKPHVLAVGPFELRQVVYSTQLQIGRSTPPTRWMEAVVSFWKTEFAVRYDPGVSIVGRLVDPDGVRLGALVEAAFGIELPFGLDTLTLVQAELRRGLSPATTGLSVEIAGAVDLVPGAIQLNAIQLAVSRADAEEGAAFGIGAMFAVGPVVLVVQAERTKAGGWVFEGQASSAEGISLRDLVGHLVERLGASVPDDVPDVRLRELEVRFDSTAGTLEIDATTTWTVADSVPVVAGEHQVLLGLVLSKGPSGRRTAQLTIDWTLERSGRSLEANVVISGAAQSFAVDFRAPAEPLKLSEVAADLGLGTELPAGTLVDDLFQLSTLSIGYARPAGTLDVAFTRDLGDGVLLMELDRSAASKRFQASWISVRDDATIGIRDLAGLTGHREVVDGAVEVLGKLGLGGLAEEVVLLLSFRELGFTYDAAAGSDTFTVLARSAHPSLDETFVRVRRGTNPGLIVGATFRAGKGIGDLPFVPDAVGDLLDGAMGGLHLEPTCLLLSTVADGHFVPPGFDTALMVPSYGRPGVTAPRRPFGQTWMRVGKGVALGARLRIPPESPVRRVIDASELDAQLIVSTERVTLQASLNGCVQLGDDTNGFTLGDPMLRVSMGTGGPLLDLGGTVELALFGLHVSASGWLSIMEESVEGHLALANCPWVPISLMPGVHFQATEEHPFYLEIGQQFEPPGLTFGVEGRFFIYRQSGNYEGDVTVVLEIVEEIPQPLYVDLTLDRLDVPGLLEALTGLQYDLHMADVVVGTVADGAAAVSSVTSHVEGGAAHAVSVVSGAAATAGHAVADGIRFVEGVIDHLECVLTGVSIDDVLFRWCDSVVNLPDGSVQMPGVAVHGRVNLFGWHAFALLEFSSNGIPSLNGHFEAEPIDLGGVLKIWGDGAGIRTPPRSAADLRSTSSAESGEWFIQPGGPVFHVSTSAAPFLHASLHASLFGFLHADIQADVTDEGFAFDFRIGAGNALTAELACQYWKDDGRFEAHGAFGLHLHGEIGPILPGIEATRITLDTDLEADVDLVIDGDHFELRLRGEFNFQGLRLRLPELVINVAFASLAELASHIWDRIKALAHEIFEEVIAPIGRFFEEAAKEIAHVAVEAVEAVEHVAEEAAAEVVRIANTVADAVKEGAHAVEAAAESVARVAKQVVDHAATAAKEAAQPLHDLADRLREEHGNVVVDAVAHVAAIGVEIAAAVTEAAAFVADVANQAASWVAERLRVARDWCAQRLADAYALVDDLGRRLRETLALIGEKLQQLRDEIVHLGEQIKAFFEDVGHAFEDFGHEVAKVCD